MCSLDAVLVTCDAVMATVHAQLTRTALHRQRTAALGQAVTRARLLTLLPCATLKRLRKRSVAIMVSTVVVASSPIRKPRAWRTAPRMRMYDTRICGVSTRE